MVLLVSRRTGRGGRLRHPDHRGGPRPHDPTRVARSAAPGSTAAADADPVRPTLDVDQSSARAQVGGGDVDAHVDPIAPVPQVVTPVAVTAPDPRVETPGETAVESGIAPALPPAARTTGPTGAGSTQPSGERHGTCTTAQLRRFIKSRAYIPMHEIRRRFLIAAEDDDVTGIDLGRGRIFVGLPEREGLMLGELLRGGEVGYELQLDPVAPIVVGVYPMRPVTRG